MRSRIGVRDDKSGRFVSKGGAKAVARIGDILGKRTPINSVKLKKITSDLTFDDSKARELLGWNPTPVLEGLRIS